MNGPPGLTRSARSTSDAVFQSHDRDGDGELSARELSTVCSDLHHDLSPEEALMALYKLDADGNGSISEAEFQTWWRKGDHKWSAFTLSDKEKTQLRQATEHFNYFDSDRNMVLTKEEFALMHPYLAQGGITELSAEECFEELDLNENGQIAFPEYLDWLVKKGRVVPERGDL